MRIARSLSLVVALAGATSMVACSDDPTSLLPDAGDLTDTGGERTDTGNPSLDVGTAEDTGTTVPEGCDRGPIVVQNAYVRSDGSNATYQGVSASSAPYDLISIQSLADWDGPTTAGTYSLDGINYLDCGLCLLAYSDCTDDGCDKTFYADAGDVTIDAIGFGEGEEFSGSFTDVVFREVTISEDYVSTPVEGGETWCMDGFTFEGFAQAPAPAGECDPNLYDCIGENMSELSLQNCETEEMVDVMALNAEHDGTWMILTAGWCTACHQWLPQVFGTLDTELSDYDLNVMIVLGENQSGNQPTLEYCRQYAAQYDHPVGNFYVDHDGEYSYATVFGNIWIYPSAEGAFGLPWNGMFRGDSGEFVYADGADPAADINVGLNELLSGVGE